MFKIGNGYWRAIEASQAVYAGEEPRGVSRAEGCSWYIRLVSLLLHRLHKIIKGQCGKEIITGKDPIKYVNDCIRRAEKITKAGIDLILVFDGGVLPRKLNEEETRRR